MYICMTEDGDIVEEEELKCESCGSKNLRTTKKYRVCIRCGHRKLI